MTFRHNYIVVAFGIIIVVIIVIIAIFIIVVIIAIFITVIRPYLGMSVLWVVGSS